MNRKQIIAVLLSAVMTVSACMPMNGIVAFASESTEIEETCETAGEEVSGANNARDLQEVIEEDQNTDTSDEVSSQKQEDDANMDMSDEENDPDVDKAKTEEDSVQVSESDLVDGLESEEGSGINEDNESSEEDYSGEETQDDIDCEETEEPTGEEEDQEQNTKSESIEDRAETIDEELVLEDGTESSKEQVGDFTYTVSGGEATITEYKGTDKEVIIPSMIGEYTVTCLGTYAFCRNSNILSIEIPDSVTNIEYKAFAYCSGLTSIFLSDNVASIDKGSFEGCDNLKAINVGENNANYSSIDGVLFNKERTELIVFPPGKEGEYTIPNSVTSVGQYGFYGCKNLTNVYIPASVNSIDCPFTYYDATVFGGCSSLNSITVDANNSNYSSVEGVLLNKEQTELIKCPEGKEGYFSIPDTVVELWYCAFMSSDLTEITIPESVKKIGYLEFTYSHNLTRIKIPEDISKIGGSWFESCSSLKSIYLPNGITEISIDAFRNCTALENVYFGGSNDSWDLISIDSGNDAINTADVHYYSSGFPGTLSLTEGPITLDAGRMTVLSANYRNFRNEPDEINGQLTWSYTSPDGGEVTFRRSTESYLGYLCEVVGVSLGTCTVTASTDDGLKASVEIVVVPAEEETKEVIKISGKEEHLSGSNNYVLDDNSNGSLDLSGPITSEVKINSGSRYSASSITIKKNGYLSVVGTLTASDIHVEAGGTLEVLGRVNVNSILVDGGNWFSKNGGVLTGYGVVSTDYVEFKGYGTCAMGGQLIAKRGFAYNSSIECSEFDGTLFVGGSMNAGKNMKAASNGLTTVIYGDTSGREFVFHKKCNIGNVFALNEESYRKIGIPKNNRVSALQYWNLIQSDTGRWSYSPTVVSLGDDGINDWEQEQGAYYRNLANNQQNVISISFLQDPTERDFVEKLAVAWIGSIEAQVNRGLLTISKGSYELYFKMNRRDYVLKYEVDGYGNYGNLGVLYFGHADDNDLQYIGVTASASIENFKAGAATYLAESYVQEYYKFATGFLPSWKTEASLKKKLEQMGTKAVIKYFQKNIENNLFGTLAVTKGAEYKQLEKTFSISKMVLNGDVKGLWKYAAKEVTGSAKRKAANSRLDASAEIDEDLNDEGGLSAAKATVSDEITDEFLRDALLDVLGDDGTGNPDFTNQEGITYLDLSDKYIQSLNGIQKFTNLQTLILSYNEISDLSPISEMTTLRYLYINGQDISDLTPISNLSNLLLLDAGDNNISSIGSVAGMTSLRRLVINENPVTSLYGLENCTCLETLEADGISLKDGDLSALNRAEKLKEIHLHGSGVQSIGGINVSSLVLLDIGDNEVESLDPIISAAKLESVDASENLISEIPQLKNCKALASLDLSGNALDDLSGLESMPSMQILKLSDCELVSGDIQSLSSIAGLKEIDLSWNTMLDDLSSLSALENLESVDVRMTDMVVLSSPISLGSHEVIVYEEETPHVSVEQEEYIFTGDAVEPSIIIEYGDRKVMEDVDYKVSYANNMEPGTATATVEGVGKCLGTLSVDFSIRAANIVSSGTCGDNLNWSLDELGILSITGSGEMYDYPELDVWDDVNYDIKKIVIEDGAESIGKMAFNAFPNLKSISLPSSIREIGDSAFLLCSSLKEIVLPEGVAVIGSHAFDTCSSLESVTIPRSITEIGDDIFYNCRNNIHVTYSGSKEEWNKLGVDSTYITVDYTVRTIDDTIVSGVADRIYCGQAIAPKPVVVYEDTTLTEGVDYTVSYKNNTNAGTATVTITGKGRYAGTVEKTFTIAKAAQSITAKLSAATIPVGGTATLTTTGAAGKVTSVSSNAGIASVSGTTLKGAGVGTATITVTAAETANYKAGKTSVTVKIVPAATASVKAENLAKGIKVSWAAVPGATGYDIYRNGTKLTSLTGGATVSYTDKGATANGTAYTYKVVAKATAGVSPLSNTVTTYCVSRPKISSVKNTASKKATAKWKKNAKANGYELQYCLKKNFKSGVKKATIKKKATVSRVLKSLKKKKTYYVRIRTYKTVGGKKYYSAWSAAKKVKIKK